ncbi:ISSag3, transposase family protein [Streptococcus ictaluri 707-05]|uniref:ISSag3, transposase family protein n=1 Tax=Streptococcus ictaluri 707-05 TaxID=764299 RepID=G5K3A2_9STRE|nr:ISSag3, transposase family protein [Streptococcus ictaluri 707-05]
MVDLSLHREACIVQTYKVNHREEVVPYTKTIHRDIKEGVLANKPIDCN